MEMKYDSKIFVAGHMGMVGSSLVRVLNKNGFHNIIMKSSQELDLRDQANVELFFEKEKPEFVFLAAAKVGGIKANVDYPAEFIYDNLMIECNVINSSYKNNVQKLLFLGSSCIYPKNSLQPIKEDYLLSGYLEPTNQPYAIAKIAGIELCKYYKKQYGCNFISAMPTNLYGINDNFDLESSHVLPALLRKFHEAKYNNEKEVLVWGTGNPKREFLFVDDLAEACIFLMQEYSGDSHVNVGSGQEISIKELALLIKSIVGYEGEIVFDISQPDGMERKLLDISFILDLGWKGKVNLEKGIKNVYEWYVEEKVNKQ